MPIPSAWESAPTLNTHRMAWLDRYIPLSPAPRACASLTFAPSMSVRAAALTCAFRLWMFCRPSHSTTLSRRVLVVASGRRKNESVSVPDREHGARHQEPDGMYLFR